MPSQPHIMWQQPGELRQIRLFSRQMKGVNFNLILFFLLFIFWEESDMQFFLRQESGANCAQEQKALKVMRCEPAAFGGLFI